MLALFGKGNRFFFRRIHRIGKWWIADFQNTWAFNDGNFFDIVEKDVKIIVDRKQWKDFLALSI
jgi:hypothetical protein